MSILSQLFDKPVANIDYSKKVFLESVQDDVLLPHVSLDSLDTYCFSNADYTFLMAKHCHRFDDENADLAFFVSFTGIKASSNAVISIVNNIPNDLSNSSECIVQKVISNGCIFEKMHFCVVVRQCSMYDAFVEGCEYWIYKFKMNDEIKYLMLSVPFDCNTYEKEYAYKVFDLVATTFSCN